MGMSADRAGCSMCGKPQNNRWGLCWDHRKAKCKRCKKEYAVQSGDKDNCATCRGMKRDKENKVAH